MRLFYTTLFLGVLFACQPHKTTEVTHYRYASSMVFRETPFADITPAKSIDSAVTMNINHFQLKYDGQNRLTELKYRLGHTPKAHYERFIRAPWITFEYLGQKEIRRFYNEYGHRTLVSGNVYETHIDWDGQGHRKSLVFLGLNGERVENDFGIAKYKWTQGSDGSVVEKRYDLNGKLVRNRPGFGYMITRFEYNSQDLLYQMTNMGHTGEQPSPDEAGVVYTQIGYDTHGRFSQWLNLDYNGRPIKGMSEIAQIKYIPSEYSGEGEAEFIDENGNPQFTRWGAHRVVYQFDKHGNEVLRQFKGLKNEAINVNNGIGQIKTQWNPSGTQTLHRAYYDKDDNPIGVGDHNLHQFETELNGNGKPITITSKDLNGRAVINPSTAYATEKRLYDDQGRLIERLFLDSEGQPIDHAVWQIAQIKYSYYAEHGLKAVNYFDAKGQSRKPQWNPAH
ncbi:hypothetical protein [Sediminicola luteus]|uniref:Uncharacterized protein n=1 Tax=Sediminicola luteus TaxID=319238 RepID=A0A2A4GE45_9FLAO|nr:hypothetical protein [Sediminicola luteus]PCE66256.1 hypothetical protein B7P33_02860 [Sediminicola luteus]